MKVYNKNLLLLLFGIGIAILVSAVGCQKNPANGKVTGTVTLNGKPLPNAAVTFHPEAANVLTSLGGTDNNGQYELFYSDNKTGAVPGKYTATVSTGQEWNNIPETVPDKYLNKTTSGLDYNIKSGKQIINIELNSE
ncbi:MAG: Ig-like domain-containing protein [Planctomycetaceae bacterium]|jgi:hypothetical protein|nr:Ig-like domain-containing protein [Planctomycetaceae bacterium]